MAGDKHFYIESFDTVQLSSYRVGRSPFADRYATDQTVFGMYCGRLYPLKTSPDEDPIPQYWRLRRGVLLYDVPEKPLEIVGPDAARLLDRVLACRAETLAVGRVRYGIACNEDGTVLMDGVLMRLAQDRFWYVKANGEFMSWLKANAIGLDAEVSDPDSRVLQIQGPKSLDVLDAAIGGGLSTELQIFSRRILRRLRPEAVGLAHRVDRGEGNRDLLQQRTRNRQTMTPSGTGSVRQR